MAGGAQYGLDKSYKAAAAIGSAASGPDLATSYDYFLCVKVSGTAGDTITPVTAATDLVLGIAQQRVAVADINSYGVDIRLYGISKVVAGGTVAFGDKLRPDTSARGVVTTTAGQQTFGIALGGGVVGDVIDVLLTPNAQVGA